MTTILSSLKRALFLPNILNFSFILLCYVCKWSDKIKTKRELMFEELPLALYVKLFIVLFAKQRKTSNHYITKMSFKCHVIIIYGKFEYKKMLSCKKSFIVCFLCFSSTKTNREDSTRFPHDRQRSVIVMLGQANIWAEIVIANLSRYTVCSPIA